MLYLFMISINLILIFNINYLIEVNTVTQLENAIFISVFKTIALVEDYSYLLYVSLVLFILVYFYVNLLYIRNFIRKYKREIGLMVKLKGRDRTSKVPIIYLSALINVVSCISAWLLSNLIYRVFRMIMVNLTMLEFFYFRITLFSLLLVISVGTGISATYYLFWRIYHY